MTHRTRTWLFIFVLTVGLAGCGRTSPLTATGPSSIQQTPLAPTVPTSFPPGTLSAYTLSGVVFEMTTLAPTPIEGVAVYCELCGTETHTFAYTDTNGFYSFSGVWNSGVFPTSILVRKDGYTDPIGLATPTPPNPRGPGWREVMVNGDTRFDIELVRQ